MRKTNKQSTRLADDKKGVILVTILFIVAVALIFITTSLMISISARQRVYSNAKSDQARLTVTSLAQSIWQAIYAQQLSDTELQGLAKGDTLVRFTSADVPGMVSGTATDATAYFYTIESDLAGNPTKIGIECKCDIGGEVQYYTLVLQKNAGEGTPSPMFNLTVNLGDAQMLNSCNFGLDASHITNNEQRDQVGYVADDNVMFIHGSATSDQDGSGFYGTLISDGIVYLRDVVFADDVYLIGQNAGLEFHSTSQTSEANSHVHGNVYFWGTSAPIWQDGNPITRDHSPSLTLPTVNNMYFDNRDIDDPATGLTYNTTTTGFDRWTASIGGSFGISGSVYYEAAGSSGSGAVANMGSRPSTWTSFNNGTDMVSSDINNYLTVDPNELDTTTEVRADVADGGYCGHEDDAVEINLNSITTLPAGAYLKTAGGTVDHLISCSTASDVIIYVTGDIRIQCPNASGAGFITSSDSGEGNIYFILENNARILVEGGNGSNNGAPCGLIDTRCFTGNDYDNPQTLVQTQTPRFYVFTTYNGSSRYAMEIGNTAYSSHMTVTAFLGFFPSTQGGTDGCRLFVEDGRYDNVYYGRMACSGLTVERGGNLNVPYCPKTPGNIDYRDFAYRDNTDFSVVTDECGYFTA